MREDNVEALREALSAAPANPEPLFALLDDEVEWDYVGAFPESKTYHGPGEVREFFGQWAGAFRDFELEAEKLTPVGDSVVVRLRQRGHGMETGAPVENRSWQVLGFRNGKVIRCRGYDTEAEALEAAEGGESGHS